MLFETSTPKKKVQKPRSSTPKFIKDPQSVIKLDRLLYQPQTESYRQTSQRQIWMI